MFLLSDNTAMSLNALLEVQNLQVDFDIPGASLAIDIAIPPGLTAVTGAERVGKTSLLRALSRPAVTQSDHWRGGSAAWLDLSLPDFHQECAHEIWATLSVPNWDESFRSHLIDAWEMAPHLDKPVFMLSKGHRRKVALVGLLAGNHAITCLDMPYAALDMRSIGALRALLSEVAHHPSRAWIIADYEADDRLPWKQIIQL